ncbi:TonB-dependent receptor plug domain-containing protein [Neptuniibacter sp. QD72_48]|uniref:TonB-dependent receptor plug domain-containing protein n=1 Tax=Neptuniibacter sp. QD72_48 TaxID=3398214 RepID=UPI0039F58045
MRLLNLLIKLPLYLPVLFIFVSVKSIAADPNSSPLDERSFDERNYPHEGDYFSTIASGHLEAIRKSPGTVSIITASEIEAMGATHLDEVLETVAGLYVQRSDLSRLDPVYSIRGIQNGFSTQVLVLFNGIEFKNPFSGGLPTTFRLPLNAIERIEVIKGASSALYGANAYSGVINIVPKRSKNFAEPMFQARAGSFGSRDFTVQHSDFDGFGKGYFFSLEHQQSDGDDSRIITQDFQSLNDITFGSNASLAPGPLNRNYSVTNAMLNIDRGDWSWNNWFWHNRNAGNGQGGARALDSSGYEDTYSLMSHLQYRGIINSQYSLENNYSYHYQEGESTLTLFPANSIIPIGSDGNPYTPGGNLVRFTDGVIGIPSAKMHKSYVDLILNYVGSPDHIWRFQVGGQFSNFRSEERKNFGPGVLDGTETVVDGNLTDVSDQSYVYSEDNERHNAFLAIQDQWALNKNWTLTVGGRIDHYSDFGRVFNPRMGLVWEPNQKLTGKLLYGRAFRAPSFSELYLKNNPGGLGSPPLKPEKIETLELVADIKPKETLHLQNTLFYYQADDLITNQFNGSVYQFQNSMEQQGYGIEIEGTWHINHSLTLKTQYNYLNTKNSITGGSVADIPNHTGYLAVDYRLPNHWKLNLNNHWIGSSNRAPNDTRTKHSGYSWANLKLSKEHKLAGLSTALIIKNVLDKNATTPASSIIPNDYPIEGRSVLGELTYQF